MSHSMHAIDLAEVFRENEGKTGFLFVVDPGNNEVVETVTNQDSTEEMRNKLAGATKG